MGWTKRQYIEQAFEEVGLASYVFDLTPEQLQSALRRLDAMMAEWNAKGLRLGFPLPTSPQDSSLDEQTYVPDLANEAIYTNLGIRIAPSFGKAVMPDTKGIAKLSYNTVVQKFSQPYEMQLPGTMPSGAGNKPWRNYDDAFLRRPVDPVLAGEDGPLEYN
jgi:hypothetical protein|tara:strand:+ start:443 stop:925 length:483 start_codon:yes stop_codon:yes gene_type:complete